MSQALAKESIEIPHFNVKAEKEKIEEIPAKELSHALADLQTTSPLPAFLQMAYNLPLIGFFGYLAWTAPSTGGFLLYSILTAFFYGRLMVSTHDAIHHTWTGIPVFDELYSRILSWPFLWVHGTYSAIHHLHHKMNGENTEDPERVHWTEDEYRKASLLGKFVARNVGFFNIFVFAGFGMIFRTFYNGWRYRTKSKALRREVKLDALGILVCNGLIYGFGIAYGFALKWLVFYLLIERVAGGLLTFRAFVEHYGLWGKRHHYFQSQISNCRNIKGNFFSRWLFNNLNYHSVHHSFAKVPFYHLPEAHRRLSEVYRTNLQEIPMEDGYFDTGRRLFGKAYLVKSEQPRVSGGHFGTVNL